MELGKSVMKSMAMWDQGRCGMGGWRRPAGNWRGFLCLTNLALTNLGNGVSLASATRICSAEWYGAYSWMAWLRAVWTWSMVRLRGLGTNSLSRGHSEVWRVHCWLDHSVMISHWMGIYDVGEITFSVEWFEPHSNCERHRLDVLGAWSVCYWRRSERRRVTIWPVWG